MKKKAVQVDEVQAEKWLGTKVQQQLEDHLHHNMLYFESKSFTVHADLAQPTVLFYSSQDRIPINMFMQIRGRCST